MKIILLLLASLALLSVCAADEGSDVVVLTDDSFDARTAEGEWLLEFYAPWCGHCKKLAPIYEQLATSVKDKYNIAKIDCTIEKNLATRFEIKGYPTIKFLKDGKIYEYTGERSVDAFTSYLADGYQKSTSKAIPAKKAAEAPKAAAEGPTNVVTLKDSNFDELTSKGEWFVKFYAPWCGHCKKLAPIYEDVANKLKGTVNVGKIDCTAERAVCAQYDIKGYPTVLYIKDGEMRDYSGPRTVDGFKQYADEGWKKVDPQPVPGPVSIWTLWMANLVGQIEVLLSVNIWVILAILVTLGVLLGVVVVAMTPVPQQPKVVHYQPTSSSSTSTSPVPEITEEEVVSKED